MKEKNNRIALRFHQSLMEKFESKEGKSYTKVFLPENSIDVGVDKNGICRNERQAYLMFYTDKVHQDKKNLEYFYTYVFSEKINVHFEGKRLKNGNRYFYDHLESVKIDIDKIKELFHDQDIIEQILNHVSIVDLASEYFGVKRTGNSYSLTSGNEHSDFSSMKLFPESNTYKWYVNDKGGNVIHFVMDTEIEGITHFQDAVSFLAKRINVNVKIEKHNYQKRQPMYELETSQKQERRKTYAENIINNFFDKKDENLAYPVETTIDIENYLINQRHLDKEIVKTEIENGHIKQCVIKNGGKAVAFIGYRAWNQHSPDVVSIRSIEGNFKANISGSNMEEGFILNQPILSKDNKIKRDTVYCFESYIDMLSYMTLAKKKEKDLSHAVMISCASTNNYKAVMNYFLDDIWNRLYDLYHNNDELLKQINQMIPKNLVICFDNDEAGHLYGNKLEQELKILSNDICITKEFSYNKDWNEDLIKLTTDYK